MVVGGIPVRNLKGFEEALSWEGLLSTMHPSLLLLESRPELCVNAKHNHAVMESLLSHYRHAFPEAGERYWSTRVWTLLIWQPTFIAVAAVHGMNRSINVGLLQQSVTDASIYGFFQERQRTQEGQGVILTGSSASEADRFENLLATAESLQKLVDRLFMELTSLCRLNRTNSYGLVADSILKALLALARVLPDFSEGMAVSLGRLWCHVMKLEDRHGVAVSRLEEARSSGEGESERLKLKRKSCCRHNLVDPNDLCCSCPLLK